MAAPIETPAPVAPPRADTTDVKQKARWMLQAAREQVRQGNYDEATRMVAEVQAMDVKWGLFDDTPAKVTETIEKARPKATAATEATGGPRTQQQAKAKLKEARAALQNNQFEQAEAIALDVKSWGLSYGIFEDNPDKVAAAARALRRRDSIRTAGPKEQPSQGIYDILVQEARQMMAAGQLDEAEAKARQAQRMNVVPSLTADRAEAVLHDLAMVQARSTPAGAAPTAPVAAMPAAERPSVVAEREANELLGKNQNAAASAKFAEAELLLAKEAGQPAAPAPLPMVDPAVRQVAGEARSPRRSRSWSSPSLPLPARGRRAGPSPGEPGPDPAGSRPPPRSPGASS